MRNHFRLYVNNALNIFGIAFKVRYQGFKRNARAMAANSANCRSPYFRASVNQIIPVYRSNNHIFHTIQSPLFSEGRGPRSPPHPRITRNNTTKNAGTGTYIPQYHKSGISPPPAFWLGGELSERTPA